jgi:pyrimidine-nucleoside phosphorylase
MEFIPAEIIKKKRNGGAHSEAEIRWLIKAFTNEEIDPAQMSAWAMAVFFNKLNAQETAWLTRAMRDSGEILKLGHLPHRVDKHSSGGVGDKTSLIIGPILAACEVYTPMIGGRGLGHSGGTLDKYESLPGFRINLTNNEFCKNVEQHFFSIMGQTKDICPADKKLYALRDITGTVESLPLICGSIMSKKLAENLSGLVLDVKCGSGAFMKTQKDAEALAALLKSTGEANNVKVHALVTDMNQVLGRFAGNALEVRECWDIVCGKSLIENGFDYYAPTRDLSITLSAHAILLANKTDSLEKATKMAEEALSSGRAKIAFEKLLEYQGPSTIDDLPLANHTYEVCATESNTISATNTELVGLANIELGTGRKRLSDSIDYAAGLEILYRVGDTVTKGQPLFRLYANDKNRFSIASDLLTKSITYGEQKPLPLILKVLS